MIGSVFFTTSLDVMFVLGLISFLCFAIWWWLLERDERREREVGEHPAGWRP